MITLGLTGSIGMGKSETARMFERLGVPVYDADAAVHRLYAQGGAAVAPIGQVFPEAIKDGAVDRAVLSALVLGDSDKIKQLEAIVHPLVGQAQLAFLQAARDADAPLVVLDIPLLFETGGTKRVDKIVVVSCPPDIQRARVLARPGMTAEKFEQILKRQVPDSDKRAGADFVIETHHGLEAAAKEVEAIVVSLTKNPQGQAHA
jgi:dephospho-CoA kinase